MARTMSLVQMVDAIADDAVQERQIRAWQTAWKYQSRTGIPAIYAIAKIAAALSEEDAVTAETDREFDPWGYDEWYGLVTETFSCPPAAERTI